MYKFNKILVPTDFSKGAKDAYLYGRALARKFDGNVDLLHVIKVLKYLNESIRKLGLPLDMDKDIYPKIQTDSKQRLEQELKDNFPEEVRGSTKVLIDRKVSEAITNYAKKNEYDIIVIGSRGSHETSLIKGTTAEKVIRLSEVPVLTVQGDLPPKGVNRVLIPTDYSDLSITSLKYALSMATSLDAELTMLHVLELYGSPIENEPRGEAGRGDLDTVSLKIREKISKYLSENKLDDESWKMVEEDGNAYLVNDESLRKIKFNVVVLKSINAHYAIVDYANESSDLIVMATHGRSGLSHLFLGSTTEKVITSSDIPVLTIRPPKKK